MEGLINTKFEIQSELINKLFCSEGLEQRHMIRYENSQPELTKNMLFILPNETKHSFGYGTHFNAAIDAL